jgi:hypothetical protein
MAVLANPAEDDYDGLSLKAVAIYRLIAIGTVLVANIQVKPHRLLLRPTY